jgi:hypothetical protein
MSSKTDSGTQTGAVPSRPAPREGLRRRARGITMTSVRWSIWNETENRHCRALSVMLCK